MLICTSTCQSFVGCSRYISELQGWKISSLESSDTTWTVYFTTSATKNPNNPLCFILCMMRKVLIYVFKPKPVGNHWIEEEYYSHCCQQQSQHKALQQQQLCVRWLNANVLSHTDVSSPLHTSITFAAVGISRLYYSP